MFFNRVELTGDKEFNWGQGVGLCVGLGDQAWNGRFEWI
jgi:hypothetical protein